MTAAMSLDDWNAKFGDDDLSAPSAGAGFQFEPNIAYAIRSKSVKLCASQRGSRQLEVDCDVLPEAGSDAPIGTTRIWLELPKQATDENLPREKVVPVNQRRRDDIGRLLSRTGNEAFILSPELKGDARSARQVEINQHIIALTDEWHRQFDESGDMLLEDLAGVELFVVKVPNKNPDKAQYPYTNLFSAPPQKFPLHGASVGL